MKYLNTEGFNIESFVKEVVRVASRAWGCFGTEDYQPGFFLGYLTSDEELQVKVYLSLGRPFPCQAGETPGWSLHFESLLGQPGRDCALPDAKAVARYIVGHLLSKGNGAITTPRKRAIGKEDAAVVYIASLVEKEVASLSSVVA